MTRPSKSHINKRMSQMTCPNCGNEVEKGAAFCIRCGSPVPKRSSTLKIVFKWTGIGCGGVLGLLIGIITIGTIASSCANGNGRTVPAVAATPSPVPTPSPMPTLTPTPVPIKLSAEQLYQDYDNNEVAAKVKYEGALALITGRISTIAEAGNYYDVKLETDNFFSLVSIVCKLDQSQQSVVIQLNTGDLVTVKGIIKGLSVIDIVVEDCTLAN